MKTALFLGAGASAFAGHPTTRELMGVAHKYVPHLGRSEGRDQAQQKRIVDIVNAYQDIEKLYDGIDRMRRLRDDPNAGPIARVLWGSDTTFGNTLDELGELRAVTCGELPDKFTIDAASCDQIVDMYDMVHSVIVDVSEDDNLYVFTTNYDMVMEEYADAKRFGIVNGFKPDGYQNKVWNDSWSINTDRPTLYLTKLHGSINWRRAAKDVVVEYGKVWHRDAENNVVIAPTEGVKDYGIAPFPAIMARFEAEIEHVDVLLTIGFSYRDTEIVDIIKERLNAGMVLISVSPTTSNDIQSAVSNGTRSVEESGNMQFEVVEPGIILCDQKFETGTRDELYGMLKAAYKIASRMRAEVSKDQPR